jgi:hypothetical protein
VKIFSILHAELNDLFEFMNGKGSGGHFNAEPSRRLLHFINILRTLQSQLKNTPYFFVLDEYYSEIIKTCKNFLKMSGGSPIPDDFKYIDIIEHKPIFSLKDSTTIERNPTKTTFPLKLIGGGSYAKVYKYKDTHYNSFFVIKKANKDLTPKEIERFKNEFIELKKLNSPYIIKAYNYDDINNEYTMEFANTTLDKFINKNNNKLSVNKRINFITQIFRAILYIHHKGLLHRDISYHNILLKIYDDNTIVIKISDFGLVKILNSEFTSAESSIKGALNDPALTISGFGNYEVRHEIYTLSLIINFILSGKKTSIYNKVKSINEFIIKGLSANINERYSSVEEMYSLFNKIKGEIK